MPPSAISRQDTLLKTYDAPAATPDLMHVAPHASAVADAIAHLGPINATATKHLYLHNTLCATPGCCNPAQWCESCEDDTLEWPPMNVNRANEITRYGILHRFCRENDTINPYPCVDHSRWETHDFEVYGEGVKNVIKKVLGPKGLADAGINEHKKAWVLKAPWKPFAENWDQFVKASEKGGIEGEAAAALVRAMGEKMVELKSKL